MANVNFFPLIAIFSSYLWIATALTSVFFFSANISTTWTNNEASLPQTIHFLDGSMARFILLKDVSSYNIERRDFGFGCCFYCSFSSTDSCYLSIIFVEMPNGTIAEKPPQVVWSANRDSPIRQNAMLTFSHDGDLTLADANGAIVWSSNTSGNFVSGMSINEQGNMVLFNQTNGTVWQSFDHLTDTLLVGQTMREGQRLTSSISSVNMSHGLFYLRLDYSSLSAYVEGHRPTHYLTFSHNTWAEIFLQLTYVEFTMGQVTFFFQSNISNGAAVGLPFHTPNLGTAQFLRMDVDGGLRIYGWEHGSGWKSIYVFLNGWDECQFPLKCGRYGVCQSGQCICPVGVDGVAYFTPVNSQFPNLGCHQITPSPLQSTSTHYQLINFGHLSYFSYFDPDEAILGLENEESCKQACQRKASCKAAFFKYDNSTSKGYCYLPSEVLSIIGTPMLSTYYSSSFIKVQILSSPQASSSQSRRVVALASSACVLILLVLAIVCLWVQRKKKKYGWKDQDYLEQVPEIPLRFSCSELCIATGEFSEMLGSGGFGMVFKGVLKDGTVVAVKRLENSGQGTKEFLAEVDTVGKIHHINLVRLIGFCVEKRHRMLVYEYMSNGSLDKWIFSENNNVSLDWKTRKKILLDIAKGLAYLHEECRQRIAHLDVKPHNILLDDDFNAKLSDFGMSKLINRDESQVITRIRGTLGYLAPEWQHSRITVKADTYSFGIVLLEVVSRRKNLDYSQPDSDVYLPSFLQKKALENRLMDIVDCQSEDMQCHGEEAIEMLRLGMWCLNSDYTRRPPMSLVVKVLEGDLELESNISYNFPSVVTPATSSTVLGSLALEASVISTPG